MNTEQDILDIISRDEWMMEILREARKLNLPDWWVGAGFVRNKVWDVLHGYTERTPLNDIDVIYFDPKNTSIETQDAFWQQLMDAKPGQNWSVKNQATMHIKNSDEPYTSSVDALAHWVETPTCVAVSLDKDDQLKLAAPHGIGDLINLIVRPSPLFKRSTDIYKERISKKNWSQIWPKLRILYISDK